jgi:hypothetical protein
VINELLIGKAEEGSDLGLILSHYPEIRVEGLSNIANNFSQDSRSPGRDFNTGPPEYEAGVLPSRPRRSVMIQFIHDQATREAVTENDVPSYSRLFCRCF